MTFSILFSFYFLLYFRPEDKDNNNGGHNLNAKNYIHKPQRQQKQLQLVFLNKSCKKKNERRSDRDSGGQRHAHAYVTFFLLKFQIGP